MTFLLKGTFSQRIKDLAFLLEVIKYKSITIDNITIDISDWDATYHAKHEAIFEYMRKVQEMFMRLGIKEDLDCDKMTDGDMYGLSNLVSAVLNGKHINLGHGTDNKVYVVISFVNLRILVWAARDDDGNYSVLNFDKGQHIMCAPSEETDGDRYMASPYILLKAEQYRHISNFDYESAYTSFISVPISSFYCSMINNSILEMLKAYDAQESKEADLLILVERLCDWLYHNDEKEYHDIYVLNKLQAIKRQRQLSVSEIGELYRLRSSDDSSLRCGACILLEDYCEARNSLDNINNVEFRNYFLSQPIFNLWKDH